MISDYQKMVFYNPTKGNLNFKEMIEEVFNYLSERPEMFYEIVVGCDSCSDERPAFPIALVVLRKKQGGRFFLTKVKYPESDKRKFVNFRQRILEEVYLSCEMSLKFKEVFRQKVEESGILLNYEFEYIHADVGEKGPTRDMIKEVVGLITSNGFIPCIKPKSFAASVVADRFT